VDWLIALLAIPIPRLARPFRFMFHVVRAREPRRVFSHVSDIQKPMMVVLLNGLAMMILFALLAVFMFGGEDSAYFKDFPTAVVSLVVLSTFDNYSSITEGCSGPTFLFFIAYVLVGHIFLMSVVSGNWLPKPFPLMLPQLILMRFFLVMNLFRPSYPLIFSKFRVCFILFYFIFF
jgi:hypothetical protein